VLRTVLASEYNHPGDRRHRLSERVRKNDLDFCLKDSIVDDSLDYFERRREEGLPKPIREQDLPMERVLGHETCAEGASIRLGSRATDTLFPGAEGMGTG